MAKPKMATPSAAAAPAPVSSTLQIAREPGKSDKRMLADMVTRGIATNALTAVRYVNPEYGAVSLTDMVDSLRDDGAAVNCGDLSNAERVLNAQALTLNAMFSELARRAAINMGTHLGASETYMRLALKAQSQSRATFETLAAIKNPPVVFAKQMNVANGPQQVNNDINSLSGPTGHIGARAGELEMAQNKLLEGPDGERLDSRTTSETGRGNQKVAAVGAINRANVHRR